VREAMIMPDTREDDFVPVVSSFETGERIEPGMLNGTICKGCHQPFREEDEIIDTILGWSMYAWSWHQHCLEADGQSWVEAEEPGDRHRGDIEGGGGQ
jgi:hypothetical protein